MATVTVKRAGESGCRRPVVVDGQAGLLASIVTEESRTGSAQCPWLIRVQSSQTIALTLLDFGLSYTPGIDSKLLKGLRVDCSMQGLELTTKLIRGITRIDSWRVVPRRNVTRSSVREVNLRVKGLVSKPVG